MIKALFDNDGLLQTLYDTNAYDDCSFIPKEAVEITEDQWKELLEYPNQRKWIAGKLVEHTSPKPISEVKKRLKQQVDMAAEIHNVGRWSIYDLSRKVQSGCRLFQEIHSP